MDAQKNALEVKKKPVKNAYGHCTIYKNYHCIFRLYTLKAKLKNILILFKPFLFWIINGLREIVI